MILIESLDRQYPPSDREKESVSRKRRRKWTAEMKARVVAAMLLPGANVTEIARQCETSRQHIYLWRKAALARESSLRASALNEAGHHSESRAPTEFIEVQVSGLVLRAPRDIDPERLAKIVRELNKFV